MVLVLQNPATEFPCLLLVDHQPGVIMRVPKDAKVMFGDARMQEIAGVGVTDYKSVEKNRCDKCQRDLATQVCGQCKKIRYCSRECQTSDWSHHKAICLVYARMKRVDVWQDMMSKWRKEHNPKTLQQQMIDDALTDRLIHAMPELHGLSRNQIVKAAMRELSKS